MRGQGHDRGAMGHGRGRMGHDRGVSDVVGYILVFSLIIMVIATVFTIGFSGLADRQQAEQVNNVERAMDVFGQNMEDVWAREAPSRATEMRLAGGTLRFEEPVEITVERDGSSVTAFTRPVTYEHENTEISYSAGALFRNDGGDRSIMLAEPPYTVRSDRVVLPLVEVSRPSGQDSVSTDGTIRATSSFRYVNETLPGDVAEGSGDVNVTVDSPRADAWGDYFGEIDGVDATVNGNTMVASVDDPEAVFAPRFRIRVRFVV